MDEENYFEITIKGKSTIHTEQEIIDLIYDLLKDKATFSLYRPKPKGESGEN